MRDIAFGASGKVEKFSKGKIGSGKQPYPCQPMFLPMAIIRHQKRQKLFKVVIGDGQAAIHLGLANGKVRLEQNTPEKAVILQMNRHLRSGRVTFQAVGGAIGNHDTKTADMQKLLQYKKSNAG